MALISCKNTSFGYEGIAVVKDLNFEVNRGDYLCIVGENGAGKSTLVKGILRLLPAMSGDMQMGEGLLAHEIGYLPQQTEAQRDFPAQVEEVVRSGLLNTRGIRPYYNHAEKQRAEALMKEVGVYLLRKKCYRELSGGQQQRVLLARALCATSKLLLLDEPVSGLDPLATKELYRLVQSINQNTGVTIVMVSHDVRAAVEYASHILHLQSTQLFYGMAGQYCSSEAGKRFLERE